LRGLLVYNGVTGEFPTVFKRPGLFLFALFLAPFSLAQTEQFDPQNEPTTVIGPRNPPLHEGTQALLAGDSERGVELTLEGLKMAMGNREEEAALSNLCAGYIKLGKYSEALEYCNTLLDQNDKNWRGYNNRAVIYIVTEQYDKADADLQIAESLNPDARTLKIARAMYMDAVHPVRPEVEIDDSNNLGNEDPQQ
jgi:tetratricopeptide (TPR) repeat protein